MTAAPKPAAAPTVAAPTAAAGPATVGALPAGDAMTVRGVSRAFGGVYAVRDGDLSVAPGELRAATR